MRGVILFYFFTTSNYLFVLPCQAQNNLNQHLNSIYTETQSRLSSGETCSSASKELNIAAPKINIAKTATPITFLADGLTKFLVKRTKEELTVSAFNKFEHILSKDTFYLKTFLPTTREKLSAISNEIYDFDLYIHALRDAFVRDLNRLPQHLQTFLLYKEGLINDPDLKAVLMDGLYLSQQAIDGIPINHVIKNYINSGSYVLRSHNDSLVMTKAGIHMLGLLWSAIVNDQGEFIRMEDFRNIMLHRDSRCVYFNLITEQAKSIVYAPGDTLHELLPHKDTLEVKMLELMLIVDDIKDVIQKKDDGDKLEYEDYARYVNAFIDVMTFGYDIAQMHSKSLSSEPKPMFFSMLDHVNSAMLKIQQRKYSSAINDLRKMLNISNGEVTSNIHERQVTLENELDGIKEKNLSGYKKLNKELKEVKRESNKTKRTQKTLDTALKYMTFVATVAEATNSDEVAQAIETFALPAGSSVTKRYSTFTFSLNAYTGGFYGSETLALKNSDQRNNVASLTAPVGVGISTGYRYKLCKKVSHNTFNAFVSLIDVGAIFAYRFDDAQTGELPEITLENIFAPGLFAETSLFNSPFTLGLGHQWSPGIRKITPLAGMPPSLETTHNARRWIVSLKLDLPLVYFAKGRSIKSN